MGGCKPPAIGGPASNGGSTDVTEMRSPTPQTDRMFFSLCGLWFVVLTLVGFSPTFYLRESPEPLPTRLIVHGVVNSAWVVLFLVQALLIAAHRPLLARSDY